MKIEAYSKAEAYLLAEKNYGCTAKQIKLTIIKKPINMFWGLIKRKGEYEVTIKKTKKRFSIKKQTQKTKDGYIKIKNGVLKVVNPKEDGRYPFIIANDPHIDVFVNDKKIKDTTILTEKDIVKFKPKTVEPITKIIVEFSEDKMQAILKIHKEKGKKFYVQDCKKDIGIGICSSFKELEPKNASLEECLKALKNANVKSEFIDIEAISRLINLPMGGSCIVAKGKRPINGVKAQIKYYFNDKSVVEIGDVLAIKEMPALPGRDGLTVTGEVIKALEVKDEKLEVEQGAILLENGVKAIASASGRPIIKNGMISVIPLLVVPGDVNKETGNIKFDGDLIIKGNVMDYMKITTKGKIKIFGSVFNAEIISNEDIDITGKVIGGKIIAGMNMINYFCIIPLIEDMVNIINNFFKQMEIYGKKDLQKILSTAYSERVIIRKNIKKIENLLSLLEDDNKCTVADLLKKIKHSFLNIAAIKTGDDHQIKTLYKELIEYTKLKSNLYINKANIRVQYTQNANLQSSGRIIITGEGSYQSNLIAKEIILYKSPTSNVKGGILIAGQGIKAGTIGSYSGVHTYCKILDKNGKINARFYTGTIINIANNYFTPRT